MRTGRVWVLLVGLRRPVRIRWQHLLSCGGLGRVAEEHLRACAPCGCRI